ncbi:MAG: undecaprenyldiphospho-muramoylpentapeptide beta-N-acetylglucosaminyltransferase [Planctomycetota bacterium]|nr:undecaprenyldiphospho-muramoylpentapeptide beta-N-acetylglucosaminyltransferase [Planctomycetota bacterium]MDA0921627.1 undecaprenyldiphospho-muramoylpentapeptide beta-N-acetylglucosaminyltransferase [Planctomycetota bacterium]
MSNHTDTPPPLYVFAGGGTGGHLAPGIAVAEHLRREQPDCRIRFVGSGRPVERQMLGPTDFEYSVCETFPLNVIKSRPLRFMRSHWQAYRSACRSIDADRPTAIIGLGGFASVPLALAAKRCRIPCLLLEQNSVPGRANRWLSRWHPICLTFEESARYLPDRATSHLTGNPLREEIRQLAVTNHLLPQNPPTLLVLGGSLGSRQVNDSIFGAVDQLASELTGWRIIHQTGPEGAEAARDHYSKLGIPHEVAPFFPDLPTRLPTATLAVARAGASTLTELAAVGIPAILVPYPTAADDHQTRNAQFFADSNAAVIVVSPGRSFTPIELASVLKPLLTDTSRLLEMSRAMKALGRPAAAADVVATLFSVLRHVRDAS